MRTVSYEGWEWLGAPLSIDLANTLPHVRPGEPLDLIAGRDGIEAWLAAQDGRLPRFTPAPADAQALRELRDALYAAFRASTAGGAPSPAVLRTINDAAAAVPDGTVLRARAGSVEAALPRGAAAARAIALVARSAIALYADGWIGDLKVCGAPGCSMFFLARGRQEWCSVPCGNRARAARHARRNRSHQR